MARPRNQRGLVEPVGNKWRIRWREYGPGGQVVRRSRGGFDSEKAAERELRRILDEIDDGTYVPPSPETLGEYLWRWLAAQRAHIAPNTADTYEHHIAYYLAPGQTLCDAYRERTRSPQHPHGLAKPSLAAEPVQKLATNTKRISAHFAQLLERGKRDGSPLAPKTVAGVLITLRAALTSAYEEGLLRRPVKLKRVRVPKRRPSVYTPDQVAAFLKLAFEDRLAAMWLLAATSALRPSELLGLTWTATDLDAGVASIYQKEIKVKSRVVLVDGTKTDGSAALITLEPIVVAALRDWRERQREERRLWPGTVEDHGLVFTWENGAPLKPDWVNRRFQRLARQAGLPRIRLYDLRHGWATAALRAGIHPKLVQEVMRHASYTTTADTYSHVMPGHSAEAVTAVTALFGELPWSPRAAEPGSNAMDT